jgi:DNA modification methylase
MILFLLEHELHELNELTRIMALQGEVVGYDLFGQPIIKQKLLRDEYIEPPFSVLDTKGTNWTNRKNKWKQLGIRSEIGREAVSIHMGSNESHYGKKGKDDNSKNYTSIFDPVLCELTYKWFCDEGGKILDPFAGGSVRGIVAGYLGYQYTGIDLRKEQVDSNVEQADEIIKDSDEVKPTWICGDSNQVLDTIEDNQYDLMFTCPPYADLEVYSDLPEDLSNMSYKQFEDTYASIIKKSASKLKKGGYAVIVVGEIRRKDDKNGAFLGLVPMTINHCVSSGLLFYNEAILLTGLGSAAMRVEGNMKTRKLVKIHQNVLVFKKA